MMQNNLKTIAFYPGLHFVFSHARRKAAMPLHRVQIYKKIGIEKIPPHKTSTDMWTNPFPNAAAENNF